MFAEINDTKRSHRDCAPMAPTITTQESDPIMITTNRSPSTTEQSLEPPVPQAPPPDVATLVAIEHDWEPITIDGAELAVDLREHRARTGIGLSDAEIDAVAARVDGLTIRPAAVIGYLRQKEAETANLKGGDR